MLIAACSGEALEKANILQQSTTTFEQLQHILTEEKMEFSDVIRQWNYIEKIIETDHTSNLKSQHYQVFNDVRSKYYQHANFGNGFPAATGIGMDYGGIAIDIIAVQNRNKGSVVAVKSPLQLDAYNYSQAVLAENNTMSDFCQTTPKFERAKILVTPANKWVFISGTAAIKGQVSIPALTAENQTEMTIQNILNLISIENLKKHGFNSGTKARMSNMRVYVKNRTDMPRVKSICADYFPQLPAIYIVADICRPELLVEIEGQAII
jgi:enamine deaminase RidA (YjgF/YER057c/UK114 family)